jgi:hypothetical protein
MPRITYTTEVDVDVYLEECDMDDICQAIKEKLSGLDRAERADSERMILNSLSDTTSKKPALSLLEQMKAEMATKIAARYSLMELEDILRREQR